MFRILLRFVCAHFEPVSRPGAQDIRNLLSGSPAQKIPKMAKNPGFLGLPAKKSITDASGGVFMQK